MAGGRRIELPPWFIYAIQLLPKPWFTAESKVNTPTLQYSCISSG